MNKIIYYTSKTGHSKQYAFDIAKRINAECFDIKKIKKKKMKEKDYIIYIAPLNNNHIRKVDVFLRYYKKIKKKNLFIIAVGMQPKTPERRQSIIAANILEDYHIRLYELGSGIDLSKISNFKKKFIRFGLNLTLKKDKSLASYKDKVEELFKTPIEYYDKKGVDEIVEKIQKIEKVV